MKTPNQIAVERALATVGAYWDDRAGPEERAEMLQTACETTLPRVAEAEGAVWQPFGSLAPRYQLTLALAHLAEDGTPHGKPA